MIPTRTPLLLALAALASHSLHADDADRFAGKSTSIAYPTTDAQKRSILAAKEMAHPVLHQRSPLSYHTILRTGEQLGGETFGLLKDSQGKPLTMQDGSPYICNGQFGGSGPDHTEFIEKKGHLYMITQFECQVGALYMAELDQNPKTGEIKAKNLRYIDQGSHHGGWVHCAGMKTPWNSFLGSEEYEPDAAKRNTETGSIDPYYDTVAPYFGGDLRKANPYYYGWITEVTLADDGTPRYTKHYSMGRFAHELAYVLPDKRTAYLSDDGSNCAMFMYVADRPGDLSAGTLFAAKWKQTDNRGAGVADLEWIRLGHADDAELKKIVDANPAFDEIFERKEMAKDGSCPGGFRGVNTDHGAECLKLRPGKETEAAFLESRRYAGYLGATTEFRKMEGITYDPDHRRLYLAMSQIAKGMEDHKKKGKANDKYDRGSSNDIRLEYNKCGAVYALDIEDKADPVTGSGYTAKRIYGILAGVPKKYSKDSLYAENSCDINSIANPDNISYLPGSNLLLIGEDTGYHQNDLVWAFDTQSNALIDRVASTPYGSETTSLIWQPDLNGFRYITLVTQHPFGESDKDKIKDPSDVQSYVGYLKVGADKK